MVTADDNIERIEGVVKSIEIDGESGHKISLRKLTVTGAASKQTGGSMPLAVRGCWGGASI